MPQNTVLNFLVHNFFAGGMSWTQLHCLPLGGGHQQPTWLEDFKNAQISQACTDMDQIKIIDLLIARDYYTMKLGIDAESPFEAFLERYIVQIKYYFRVHHGECGAVRAVRRIGGYLIAVHNQGCKHINSILAAWETSGFRICQKILGKETSCTTPLLSAWWAPMCSQRLAPASGPQGWLRHWCQHVLSVQRAPHTF